MSAFLGRYAQSVDQQLERLRRERFVDRLWAKDGALWSAHVSTQAAIHGRLGWLTAPEQMAGLVGEITTFVEAVRQSGCTHVVLLGMGGSSLCAEVCRQTFGVAAGCPELIVLDTTDPATILRAERSLNFRTTLFLVASKSGTTVEVEALCRYFFQKARGGAQFVAITDPGTPLEALARRERFHRLFLNPPDVGGRFSALSYFGLVPAALLGVDLGAFLARANEMARRCRSAEPDENPGLLLGAMLGTLAIAGRDKVTLVMAPELRSMGLWIEQLVAESTGKEGKGLVPIDGEPLGGPDGYGTDRLFVSMEFQSEAASALPQALHALSEKGHPVIRLFVKEQLDLGGEFFRWEMATAVAGSLLAVNPFDEPNVTESKENTRRILEAPGGPEPRVSASTADGVWPFLKEGEANDYVAILAYLPQTDRHDALLQALRRAIGERLSLATTLGYGPRYLHSTGQLHKGGPAIGRFLLLTADEGDELPIPGRPYGFGALKRAQALGDLAALARRGRRVLHLHLGAQIASSLERLARLFAA